MTRLTLAAILAILLAGAAHAATPTFTGTATRSATPTVTASATPSPTVTLTPFYIQMPAVFSGGHRDSKISDAGMWTEKAYSADGQICYMMIRDSTPAARAVISAGAVTISVAAWNAARGVFTTELTKGTYITLNGLVAPKAIPTQSSTAVVKATAAATISAGAIVKPTATPVGQ